LSLADGRKTTEQSFRLNEAPIRQKWKELALDSVSSPLPKRVYNRALEACGLVVVDHRPNVGNSQTGADCCEDGAIPIRHLPD
jgi:hypothetical protein